MIPSLFLLLLSYVGGLDQACFARVFLFRRVIKRSASRHGIVVPALQQNASLHVLGKRTSFEEERKGPRTTFSSSLRLFFSSSLLLFISLASSSLDLTSKLFRLSISLSVFLSALEINSFNCLYSHSLQTSNLKKSSQAQNEGGQSGDNCSASCLGCSSSLFR